MDGTVVAKDMIEHEQIWLFPPAAMQYSGIRYCTWVRLFCVVFPPLFVLGLLVREPLSRCNKLAQFPAYHLLRNVYFLVYLAIVYGEAESDKAGQNRSGSRLGFDDRRCLS